VTLVSNNFKLKIAKSEGSIHMYAIEYPPSLPKEQPEHRREALRNAKHGIKGVLGDPSVALGNQLFAMVAGSDT